METMGVEQAKQSVVNQANKTSTQEAHEKARQKTETPVAAPRVAPTAAATNELKIRVDHILADLKKNGVNLPDQSKQQNAAPQAATRIENKSYIDVLHDVLVGNTSVDKISFAEFSQEAASGDVTPKLPAYPFDRSFLQVSLQYLKSLVSGEGSLDQHLAQRIQSQLEALEQQAVQKPASALDQSLFEQIV